MPKTVAFFCGAVLGKSVYVTGGREKPDSPGALKTLWRLDLSKPEDARQWETLEPCPGPARMLAVAGAAGGAVHLFSGVELVEDADGDVSRRYLKDAWSYTSGRGWTQLADLPRSVAAAPTPALALGSAHLAILGGDDGSNVHHGTTLKNTHPGFSRVILAYHTITDTWTAGGSLPKQVDDSPGEVLPPVTTSTVRWGDRWIVPSGEIRPGVRTPAVLAASERDFRTGFGILDFSAVGLYLAVLVGMGVYFSRREKTTDDFFLGGRRVPWWAAGLSIFGTQLSAITFMAMPAKAYATDWVYIVGNFLVIVAAPVVIHLYLPFFRRLNVTTAYEYLEKRFNTATRLLGSAAFILLQLGRMGVVVYLPAIALSAVTGIDTVACIVVMGVLATLYTVLGGIEAVIWTDVIQVIVLIGGAALCLALIVGGVDGGISEVVSLGRDAGKFRVFNWTWSMASTAVWVVFVGKISGIIVCQTADQTVVQRYLTTSSERGAAKAIWTNGILSIPVAVLFFALGTSLWAFYKVHPGLLVPLQETDRILPWFIAHELPQGVAGLVIAALFAAAMSSLDSSMNSIATALTTDWYRRFRPEVSDAACLFLARVLTVLLGAAGTGFAIVMAMGDTRSLWDQYLRIIGLFGGGLAGLFAVGIFTRRANGFGAVVGFLASAVVLYMVQACGTVHLFLYSTVGIVSCAAFTWIVSWAAKGPESLTGLTVWTMVPAEEERKIQ